MPKELSAAQYEDWLNSQKRLALVNEDARRRLDTAAILAQAELRRETTRKREQES